MNMRQSLTPRVSQTLGAGFMIGLVDSRVKKYTSSFQLLHGDLCQEPTSSCLHFSYSKTDDMIFTYLKEI